MVVLTLLNLIASTGRAIGEIMGASTNRDAQDRPSEAVSGLGPPRLNELFRSRQRIALLVKQRDCFLNAVADQNCRIARSARKSWKLAVAAAAS